MKFETSIFDQFHNKWALVCAGDIENHNAMTISWGQMGTLWSIPVVTVFVKPCRYTYGFMNDNEYFTVSFYGEEYKKALGVMGSKSGRDCDKDKEAGLTPVEIEHGVTYKEAEVTILCKKIYHQDLDIDQIPDEYIQKHYTEEKPHRVFVGEVVDIIR